MTKNAIHLVDFGNDARTIYSYLVRIRRPAIVSNPVAAAFAVLPQMSPADRD
jgi:hypothetical protein